MEILEISIGSHFWYLQMVVNVLLIVLFVVVGSLIPKKYRFRYGEVLGFALLYSMIFYQIYLDILGAWSIRALPLEVCNIVSFAAVFALYTRNQWAYELCLFVGIFGPFQAILTPAIFQGSDDAVLFMYFFSHVLIIFTPFFMTFALGMRPRPLSWFKTPASSTVMIPVLIFYNAVFDTNHMFLAERPLLDHPLNFGPWPFYIVLWLSVLFISSFLISLFFWQRQPSA